MRSLKALFIASILFVGLPSRAYAAPIPDLSTFTSDTLGIITLISTAAAVLFLVVGGYQYITSNGDPKALASAKKTIKNTIIGLLIVLSASTIVSLFKHAVSSGSEASSSVSVNIDPIESVEPSEGLTQVLIDAISGLIQNIIESAAKPIVDGVISYLTTTPSLMDNSVIFDFWLVSLGIVDSLFVLVVALLGFQFMSASVLGFEEVDLKQLLPRIGLAFLGANVSLFLADYLVTTANVLIKTILDSTGGLDHAWVVDAASPTSIVTGTTPLIILIFMIMFLILSIVLLLMYISRLIMISLFAVLSPFLFLVWSLPKYADFASIASKTYVVTVFITFVHVVIIQLASSFLTLPEHSENSLISIAVAIGLFFTLLKTPNLMMQMVFYTSNNGLVRKLGNQLINATTSEKQPNRAQAAGEFKARYTKTPRKEINA